MHPIRPQSRIIPAGAALAAAHRQAHGLLGAWPLAEGGGTVARDLAGRLNGAFDTGGAARGPRSSVAAFSGSNYVNLDTLLADYAALDGTAHWTVTFWFRTSSLGGDINAFVPSGPHIIERRRAVTFDRQLFAGIHTGGVLGGGVTIAGPSSTFLTSTTVVNDGQVHFGALSRAGTGSLKLYVDGRLEASSSSVLAPALGQHLTLGCRTTNAGARTSHFTGDLWDVRLYTYQLADALVTQLYERPEGLIHVPRRRAFAAQTASVLLGQGASHGFTRATAARAGRWQGTGAAHETGPASAARAASIIAPARGVPYPSAATPRAALARGAGRSHADGVALAARRAYARVHGAARPIGPATAPRLAAWGVSGAAVPVASGYGGPPGVSSFALGNPRGWIIPARGLACSVPPRGLGWEVMS